MVSASAAMTGFVTVVMTDPMNMIEPSCAGDKMVERNSGRKETYIPSPKKMPTIIVFRERTCACSDERDGGGISLASEEGIDRASYGAVLPS